MFEGEAVREIATLAQDGLDAVKVTTEINGHVFTTKPLHHLPLKPEAEPEALKFSTLGALAAYIRENRDQLEKERCVVHVASATEVRLLGPLTGEKRQRFVYATATARNLVGNWLGQYHGQEDFIVALQSRFEPIADRAVVLGLIAKLKQEQSIETEDDGVSQRATAKVGVHLAQQIPVPNPVRLAPYRTFREVEQPGSHFVLRVQQGPRCALFEADGGAWELVAVERIASWLEAEIVGVPVLR